MSELAGDPARAEIPQSGDAIVAGGQQVSTVGRQRHVVDCGGLAGEPPDFPPGGGGQLGMKEGVEPRFSSGEAVEPEPTPGAPDSGGRAEVRERLKQFV